MSHFSLAVFIDKDTKFEDNDIIKAIGLVEKLEEMLEPYKEDCLDKYLEFDDCTSEVLEAYENNKEDYDSIDVFAMDYFGYDKKGDKYGCWRNPNAKWDWYEVGGRFSFSLITNKNFKANASKLKNINWEKMKQLSKNEVEKIWNKDLKGIERRFYGILDGDTKESFLERASSFSTYAVLTKDGKWHSVGEMGWFGFSTESEDDTKVWNENYYDRFIKNEDPETTLLIVDCHI